MGYSKSVTVKCPLMPGSLVLVNGVGCGTVARVCNVYSGGLYDLKVGDAMVRTVPHENLEGIVITERILKKNGFVRDGDTMDDDGFLCKSYHLKCDGEIWGYLEKDCFCLRMSGSDNGEGVGICDVSGLQAALCVVGHEELAMNFKV